jgi:murein DD-endopeptidase MepM/ murein hydrolase activator NlpD
MRLRVRMEADLISTEHRMRTRWLPTASATLAWLFGFMLATAVELHAQQAHLAIAPARPLPGAIVRLNLTDAGAASDAIVSVTGTMAGEPLHFVGAGGAWRAIGAVPVDSGGDVVARVVASRASGRTDTLSASVTPPPLPPPKEQLAVAEQYGKPLDAATEARVEQENQKAIAVGRQSQESPPKWTTPFEKPRDSEVSSSFGSGRTFNGQVASRHLGVDFRGAVGTPIRAANDGVVVLVDNFFLGGNVVYIDHGGGLTTGYLHLSKAMVNVGDNVKRGQVIGLVGATGRVTGPHLHWAARYGALTVNPLDLLTLEPMTAH